MTRLFLVAAITLAGLLAATWEASASWGSCYQSCSPVYYYPAPAYAAPCGATLQYPVPHYQVTYYPVTCYPTQVYYSYAPSTPVCAVTGFVLPAKTDTDRWL